MSYEKFDSLVDEKYQENHGALIFFIGVSIFFSITLFRVSQFGEWDGFFIGLPVLIINTIVATIQNRKHRDPEVKTPTKISRLLSTTYDFVFVIVLIIAYFYTIDTIFYNTPAQNIPDILTHDLTPIVISVYLYYSLTEVFLGRSIGKCILGIKIVTDSNKRLSTLSVILRAFIRTALFVFIFPYLLYGIINILFLKKTLHDSLFKAQILYE